MSLVFFLIFFGQFENLFGLQIVFKMISYRIQQSVELFNQSLLDFFGLDKLLGKLLF